MPEELEVECGRHLLLEGTPERYKNSTMCHGSHNDTAENSGSAGGGGAGGMTGISLSEIHSPSSLLDNTRFKTPNRRGAGRRRLLRCIGATVFGSASEWGRCGPVYIARKGARRRQKTRRARPM